MLGPRTVSTVARILEQGSKLRFHSFDRVIDLLHILAFSRHAKHIEGIAGGEQS